MRLIKTTLSLFAMAALCRAQGVITTVAGNGSNSSTGDGGAALSASFHPNGLTIDSQGNIYIADLAKSVIRKVNTAGIITTVAGIGNGSTVFNGDGGQATGATIYLGSNHNGIAVDRNGNLYIADPGHHRVRKVDTSGIITTVAGIAKLGFSGDGGPATLASLWSPSGVAVDNAGNLYIADSSNARIRKVDGNGIITTVAGNGAFASTGDGGQATAAALFLPMSVVTDNAGNLYITDQNAYNVRKVDATGIITTLAGSGAFGFAGDGGPAAKAEFAGPYSAAADNFGNVYIADFGNRRVRKVDANGVITTVAGGAGSLANIGDGGPPTSALLQPADVAVDSLGNYYIADFSNNRIRKVTLSARAPGLAASAGALYFSGIAGGNTPAAQVVSVTTPGVVALGFTVSVSTETGGGWLAASIPGAAPTPTLMTVSINGAQPLGTYHGTITLTPTAPDLPKLVIPVTLNVTTTAPAKPTISADGVQNGASFLPGLASNTWVTIKGTNLTSTSDNWNNSIVNGQLPTSLDGVTVLINGRPAYLQYISSTQINLVVPDLNSTSSSASVVINNAGASSTIFNAPLKQYAPAFFTWPGNQAVATRQDFSWAVKDGTFAGASTAAAKPGDVIILWGTGFGPTSPAVPIGVQVPADQTYSTAAPVTVTLGGTPVTVYGAALASGNAALCQVAIQVPASFADGDYPIQASIGGVQSPSGVVLSVRK